MVVSHLIGGIRERVSHVSSDRSMQNAAATVLVRILSAFLGFSLQVFLARSLNLGDYGLYALLWTWLGVIHQVTVVGFSDASVRFLPRYMRKSKANWIWGFLLSGFWTVVVGSLVVSVAGLLTIYFISENLEPAFLLAITVVLFGLPLTSLENYLVGVCRSFGWFLLATLPGFIFRPLLLAIGVYVALSTGFEESAALVLGIAIAITGLSVVLQGLVVRARLRKMVGHGKRSRRARLWIVSSIAMMPAMLSDEIFFWADILMVGFLLPAEDVSVYFAVQRCLSLAAFVQFAFMLVMARDFSLANVSADKTELQKNVSRSTFWTFWLTLPSVVGTLAIGYPLLLLFGPEFGSGFAAMVILGFWLCYQIANWAGT